MEQREAGFVRSFVSVVGTVLLLMLLALAVAVAGVPALTQGAALTVLSGSMEPTFSPGDQIVVVGVKDPAAEISVGDIVTFMPYPDDPTLITHRVIGKGASSDGEVSFITRGDANSADDDAIGPHQIRGKYLYRIPYLGYLTNRIGGSGRLVIVVVAIVLLAYAAFALIKPRPKSQAGQDNQTGPSSQPAPEPAISAEQLLARGSAVLQQRWAAARQAEYEDEADLPELTTIDQGVRR